MTHQQAHPILITVLNRAWKVSESGNLWMAHATRKQGEALRNIYRKCMHPTGGEYTIDVMVGDKRYICHLMQNNCITFSVF